MVLIADKNKPIDKKSGTINICQKIMVKEIESENLRKIR